MHSEICNNFSKNSKQKTENSGKMSKNNGKGDQYENEFPQPAKKQTFSEMIYDPRDGSFFGRTAKSWGEHLKIIYCSMHRKKTHCLRHNIGSSFTLCFSSLLLSFIQYTTFEVGRNKLQKSVLRQSSAESSKLRKTTRQ